MEGMGSDTDYGQITTYTFDAGDRLTQVVDTVSGQITRGYNGLDLLTSETTPQGSVTYTYDNASRRATMMVAGQTQIVYGFDNADRLLTQGTSQVTIGYDNASRRTTVSYPNGNNLVYGYNDANDLTSVTYKQGTTVLGDLTYSYDLAGRRTNIGGTFARSNLPPALTTTTYNANNQQKVFGTNTLNYDLHGNLNTVTDPGGTETYTWNVRNQLTGITSPGFAASFTYRQLWEKNWQDRARHHDELRLQRPQSRAGEERRDGHGEHTHDPIFFDGAAIDSYLGYCSRKRSKNVFTLCTRYCTLNVYTGRAGWPVRQPKRRGGEQRLTYAPATSRKC